MFIFYLRRDPTKSNFFDANGFESYEVDHIGNQRRNMELIIEAVQTHFKTVMGVDLKSRAAYMVLESSSGDLNASNFDVSYDEKMFLVPSMNVQVLMQTEAGFDPDNCHAVMQLLILIISALLNSEKDADSFLELIMSIENDDVHMAFAPVIEISQELPANLQKACALELESASKTNENSFAEVRIDPNSSLELKQLESDYSDARNKNNELRDQLSRQALENEKM